MLYFLDITSRKLHDEQKFCIKFGNFLTFEWLPQQTLSGKLLLMVQKWRQWYAHIRTNNNLLFKICYKIIKDKAFL